MSEEKPQKTIISASKAVPESLTKQQHQVLALIEQGYRNQQIADTLVIEVGTVKNHVHAILRKLKVKNRRQAAAYKRSGLI